MDKLIVKGGRKLKGSVTVSGAKNSVLPIMAATLLTREECIIEQVPRLSDVFTMVKILEVLGKDVIFDGHTLVVRHRSGRPHKAPYELVKTMRASVCVLGPLLAARGKAHVSMPGGCVIGVRPIDLHVKGLEALGARFRIEEGYCVGEVPSCGLLGTSVYLGGPFGSSVLATGNVMMAAALAQGITILDFAACEPEVADLAAVLQKMGAMISGAGTPQVVITGVRSLGGFHHTVIPDRIEAGTFIAIALITGGRITIRNAVPQHLGAVIDMVRESGANIKTGSDVITIEGNGAIKPVNITTLPFPGFPTDLQAQFMALMTKADGMSVVTEKVYPDRFMHVAELNRMGAHIMRSGPLAVVSGPCKLSGAEVMASDLRASAGLVAAALAAKGETTIHRLYHLDRGYEGFDAKLKSLGAETRRAKE
jgi:UDP-N-acetylglucosamine 1-carboxyvinyltransferase